MYKSIERGQRLIEKAAELSLGRGYSRFVEYVFNLSQLRDGRSFGLGKYQTSSVLGISVSSYHNYRRKALKQGVLVRVSRGGFTKDNVRSSSKFKVPWPLFLSLSATRMRKHPTKAEAKLRSRLKRLEEKWIFQEIVEDRFIVDFLFPASKLVAEVDGSIHNKPDVGEKDKAREQALRELGYQVIRFSNTEVLSDVDSVVQKIKDAL